MYYKTPNLQILRHILHEIELPPTRHVAFHKFLRITLLLSAATFDSLNNCPVHYVIMASAVQHADIEGTTLQVQIT